MTFFGRKHFALVAVIVAGLLDVGQGDLQLADLTDLFRSPPPEGYAQDFDPDRPRESYASEIRVSVNPGCPFESCTIKNGTVGVTVANLSISDTPSQEHEYHWVWSVIGHPVIQAAVTEHNSVAQVDWPAILGMRTSAGHAIDYNVSPLFSSAVMMTKLIEYNDTANTARMDTPENARDVRVYDLVNFGWRQVLIENSGGRVAIQLIAENYKHNRTSSSNGTADPPLVTNGTLNLTLSAYSEDGFGRWLPHLSHSRRTNQFDIQLQGLETNSGFNSSRFALEFVMVSNVDRKGPWGNNMTRQQTQSLDDSHTPGIFVTEELVMPGKNDSLKSYLQWRPIVYNTMERALSSSTGLTLMPDVDVPEPAATHLKDSIMFLLYGMDLNDVVVKAFNISFGAHGDGGYQKTQYHAWTFTFGTGAPIRNGVSFELLLISIILGFITAITLCILFGLYVNRNFIQDQSAYASARPEEYARIQERNWFLYRNRR